MSEVYRWNGGLKPMHVRLLRKVGPDLLPGEWMAQTLDFDAKVIVREHELEPVRSHGIFGGAA